MLIISTILNSCKDVMNCCVVMGNMIEISVKNAKGENLLSSATGIKKENIDVYYVKNGQEKLFNEPHFGADRGFLIYKDASGNEKLRLFTNFDRNEKSSITIIKFGSSTRDSIRCEYNFSGSSVMIKRLWLNGMLKSVKDLEIIK